MSKAGKFIQDYTRKCSNELDYVGTTCTVYHPWLTPDDAKAVAQIAREETIKKVCEWIKNNVYSYTWCDFLQHEKGIETGKLIKDLKKHLEGKK